MSGNRENNYWPIKTWLMADKKYNHFSLNISFEPLQWKSINLKFSKIYKKSKCEQIFLTAHCVYF